MSFTKEYQNEGWIEFAPNQHDWLESVDICTADKTPAIVIRTLSPKRAPDDRTRTIREMAQDKIKGLEIFLDSDTPQDELEFVQTVQSAGGRGTIDISFKAGPTSQIRSVLSQASIPRDIQAAVMQELEQIWSKTPK